MRGTVLKLHKRYHYVILKNVKNLNTFTLCLQILRCTQNDITKRKKEDLSF